GADDALEPGDAVSPPSPRRARRRLPGGTIVRWGATVPETGWTTSARHPASARNPRRPGSDAADQERRGRASPGCADAVPDLAVATFRRRIRDRRPAPTG